MVDRAAKRAEGKGAGYDRWAAVHNLKQMAATVAATGSTAIRRRSWTQPCIRQCGFTGQHRQAESPGRCYPGEKGTSDTALAYAKTKLPVTV